MALTDRQKLQRLHKRAHANAQKLADYMSEIGIASPEEAALALLMMLASILDEAPTKVKIAACEKLSRAVIKAKVQTVMVPVDASESHANKTLN